MVDKLRAGLHLSSALDLRSLALFRIALGWVTLSEFVSRWGDLPAFYAPDGILPLDALGPMPPIFLQLFLHPVTEPWTAGFIWVGIAAGLLLAVGCRPRLMAAICAFLLVSLNHRNELVLHLADRLQVLFLLWACLLPIGARWSADAIRSGGRSRDGRELPDPFLSIAAVGLHLQVAVVYFTTGMLKARQSSWLDGTHLGLTLDRIEYLKAPGMILRELTLLHAPLTWTVLVMQVAGGVLLLGPWRYRRLRLGVVAGLVLLQVGMGSGLHVGLFPWVSIAGLLALIPPGTWGGAASKTTPIRPRVEPPGVPLTRAGHVVAAAMLIILVVESLNDHLQFLSDRGLIGRVPAGHNLMQRWTMFTGPAEHAGWFVVAGLTESGDTINLLRGGTPPDWSPPPDPWNDFPNYRWRILLANTLSHGTQTPRQEGYLRYVARTWNEAEPVERNVVAVSLIQLRYLPGSPAGPEGARPVVLAEIPPPGDPGPPLPSPGYFSPDPEIARLRPPDEPHSPPPATTTAIS